MVEYYLKVNITTPLSKTSLMLSVPVLKYDEPELPPPDVLGLLPWSKPYVPPDPPPCDP